MRDTQKYSQCELILAVDRKTRQVVWLPRELAKERRSVRIGTTQWLIRSVWPALVTMELLLNQRDAQKDRESRVRR